MGGIPLSLAPVGERERLSCLGLRGGILYSFSTGSRSGRGSIFPVLIC